MTRDGAESVDMRDARTRDDVVTENVEPRLTLFTDTIACHVVVDTILICAQ